MEEADAAQIYLIAPEPDEQRLARLLDAAPVACVRLEMPASSEEDILRAADALRVVCHDRDIAFLLTDHFRLVAQTGSDGVHLMGSAHVRTARKELGRDGIVGAFCGASRHAGLTAGEIGADYVSFGPLSQTRLGDGETAPDDLFGWWSQTIEVPVLAEGGLTEDHLRRLLGTSDFFAFGSEVWLAEDPVAELKRFYTIISGGD